MKKVKSIKIIFPILWFFFFLTRILVLTNNYNFIISPTLLQIAYFMILLVLLLFSGMIYEKIKIVKYKNVYIVLSILFIHAILWGIIFVNPLVKSLTFSRFKTQIVFLIILSLNVYIIIKYNLLLSFIKSSFYALSLVLLLAFINNIDQVDLSNLSNIFDRENRTRNNFGLGHYNNLGAICVCNIIMFYYICISKKNNYVFLLMNTAVVIISFFMLLCSASRNALIGFILFIIVCLYRKVSIMLGKNKKNIIMKVINISYIIILLLILMDINYYNLLVESQRLHLFTISLPTYFNSGRILMGLGMVTNLAYGRYLTPYDTYWLDNGYIYTLIASGVLGFVIILILIIIMYINMTRIQDRNIYMCVFPCFIMYLFICLFEACLFESGSIINYLYLPLFIVSISNNRKGKENKNEKNRNYNISRSA